MWQDLLVRKGHDTVKQMIDERRAERERAEQARSWDRPRA